MQVVCFWEQISLTFVVIIVHTICTHMGGVDDFSFTWWCWKVTVYFQGSCKANAECLALIYHRLWGYSYLQSCCVRRWCLSGTGQDWGTGGGQTKKSSCLSDHLAIIFLMYDLYGSVLDILHLETKYLTIVSSIMHSLHTYLFAILAYWNVSILPHFLLFLRYI